MYKSPELYFIIIIGIILGLVLVVFIITMVIVYQRTRQQQEKEMQRVKDQYEQEILRSQLEIQENTLKNIAQELHDNIGQMLSVVKLSLAALPLEKEHPAFDLSKHSQKVLSKAISDLSDLTKSMHTDRISDVGLTDSIRFELSSVKNAGLIDVEFSVDGKEFDFPSQKAIFLFRIFQELLNNVLKHARASLLKVRLIYGIDNNFELHMQDNGSGFDVQAKRESTSSSKGVGLKSLFNRAYLIGAELKMDSNPGQGTRVLIHLPPHQEYDDKKGK